MAKKFKESMTVAEAMSVHPKVREVFAGFNLGGCAHCAVNKYETIQQVCEGYGVSLDEFLQTLESLVNKQEKD